MGADTFLLKPYTIEELLKTLKQFISNQ